MELDQKQEKTDPEVVTESSNGERPKCFHSTFQEVLFVLTTTMATGSQSFFSGCIVGITASIGKDLNMNSAEITWINAGATYVNVYTPIFVVKQASLFFYPERQHFQCDCITLALLLTT